MENLDCFFDDVYVKTHYGFLFDNDFGFSYISNKNNDNSIGDCFVLKESLTYQNSKLNFEVYTSWTTNIVGSRCSSKEQSFISVDDFQSDAADNIAKHLNKPDNLSLKNEMDIYLPKLETTIFDDNMCKKIDTSQAIDYSQIDHNIDVIYGENETKDDLQAESFVVNLKRTKKKLVYRHFFPELTENSKTKTDDSAIQVYDWPYCRFCCKNGEPLNFYITHITKNVDGTVVCPILRKYVCNMCGATGDKAHTRKYCPFYVEN